MSTFNLFVYGSLRRGGGASAMLDGCEHLGAAMVNGILYDIDGKYAALLLYGDAPVYGEVWRCPASLLLPLDEYEGLSEGLFRRVGVEAELEGGEHVPAWVYAAGPALSRRLVPEQRIRSGQWTPPA